MSILQILVAIDFSPHAEQVLDYANTLTRKLSAQMLLVYGIQAIPLGVTAMGSALPSTYLQQIESEINQTMEKYLQRVTAAGFEDEMVIVHGMPEEIACLAKTWQVELIVMGTYGRTALGHLFLESVAEKVVRLAPCPVLETR